ncbi:MAG: hypothetical protein HDS18_01090 [Bacteroides sp.]|nr:hypothetical protein [Bacteroides sp.]
MKKFLLSLLCLFAVGLSAKAESFTVTADNSTFAASGYGEFTHTDLVSGITLKGRAQKNSGIAIQAGGGYVAVTANSNNYTITSVVVEAKTTSSKPTTLTAYASDDMYTFNNANNTSWNGKSVGDSSIKTTSAESTFNVNAPAFVLYNSTSGGMITMTKITVTYKTTSDAIAPEFSINPEQVNVTLGQTVSLPTISPSTLTYSFTTDSDNIEIDAVNRTIKGVAIGKATVNFTTEAVDGEYLEGSGSFEVNVVGKRPKMYFPNQVEIGKLGVGVVWQTVVIEEPEGVMGDSDLVTYESSDPDIVSINQDNGQIKQLDIHKTGEVTITATFNPGDEYPEYVPATAKYTIIIRDPSESVVDGYSIFDFTTSNPYGLTSWTSKDSGKYEKDADNPVTEIVGDEDVVTISFDNGSGNGYRSWQGSDSYDFRLYVGCKMTFAVPEGYKITKIGIVGSTFQGNYDPASGSATTDDKESGDELEENFGFVWLPAGETPVSEVTWTCTKNSTLSKIEVMYEAASSTLKSANLSFNPTVNGIIVDEPMAINAVTNPYGREITYSIDGLTEDQYTITPSADGKKITVLVKDAPGYYTLMAKSAAGDGYRDGLAIMRLNVFRHLDVTVDGKEFTDDSEVIPTETATTVELSVPPMAYVYYRLNLTNSVATYADDATETDDENQLPGFEIYEDGINIPAKTNGTLEFYIANYGYMSPIRKLDVGVKSAVEEIEAVAGEGEVRYFDLSGREVKGQPEKGLYIRLKGGKAEKVIR